MRISYEQHLANQAKIAEREATLTELNKQLEVARMMRVVIPNDQYHQEEQIVAREECNRLREFIQVEKELIHGLRYPSDQKDVDTLDLNLPA